MCLVCSAPMASFTSASKPCLLSSPVTHGTPPWRPFLLILSVWVGLAVSVAHNNKPFFLIRSTRGWLATWPHDSAHDFPLQAQAAGGAPSGSAPSVTEGKGKCSGGNAPDAFAALLRPGTIMHLHIPCHMVKSEVSRYGTRQGKEGVDGAGTSTAQSRPAGPCGSAVSPVSSFRSPGSLRNNSTRSRSA